MTDKAMIHLALLQWRNKLQTGTSVFSTQDAIKCGKRHLIKMLDSDQQKFILRLEELAEAQL